MKSVDSLVAFDRDIGEVIGRYVPTTVLRSRSGDINGLMPAAGKLMMLNRLLIVPGVEHAMWNIGVNLCLLVLRPRGSMVLQGSRIMSTPCRTTLKHSTCLHKWWETLKGSIFIVKPIHALRGPGVGFTIKICFD